LATSLQKTEFNEATGKDSLRRGRKIVRFIYNLRIILSEKAGDAANDAQAGYMIFHRLVAMARDTMTPIPDPDCYTFSVLNGFMRDMEGRPWFPFNPHYDAGTLAGTHSSSKAADIDEADVSPDE
jgi:hypothetical protein